MNCDQVQPLLLEYLDKALDMATARSVEEHLACCTLCRAEAEQLANCVKEVASLTAVDPPAGFTERIMARVREIERQPGLWQRLLFPLSIKLPIHATAMVLIGIMALYLLKRVPFGEEAEPTAPPAAGVLEKKKAARLSAESQEIDQVSRANEKSSGIGSENTLVPASKPQRKTADETANLRAGGEESNVFQDRREVEKKMFSATQPVGIERKERAPAAEAGPAVPNSPVPASGGPTASVSPESALGQLQAASDVELVVRHKRAANVQPRNSLGALDKSAKLGSLPPKAATEQGAPLLPAIPDSAKPQELWITITRAQYDQLRRELLAVGSIESETWLSSRESALRADDRLWIKVTVLPAEP